MFHSAVYHPSYDHIPEAVGWNSISFVLFQITYFVHFTINFSSFLIYNNFYVIYG